MVACFILINIQSFLNLLKCTCMQFLLNNFGTTVQILYNVLG